MKKIYICFLSIIIIFLFCLNTNVEKIKVAIIDGEITQKKNQIEIRHIIKTSQVDCIHGNIVFDLLSKNLNSENINYVNYVVLEKNQSIGSKELLKALQNAEKDNIDIINLSGGFYFYDKDINKAIGRLLKKGVVIVSASGNNYGGKSDFPARKSGVVAVGSMRNGKISDFSSKTDVDVFEDGENIKYKGKIYKGTSFSTAKITNKIIQYTIKNNISVKKAEEKIRRQYEKDMD